MGASSNSQQQAAQQTSQQDAALLQQAFNTWSPIAQGLVGRGLSLEQPAVDYYSSLASGDPTKVLQAAGPQIGQFARAGQAAQDQLRNQTGGKGAGFDFGSSQIPMQTYSNTAGYLANIVNQAPAALAQIGGSSIGSGLQAEGTAIGAGSASNTAAGTAFQGATTMYNQQQQQKQSLMNIIGFGAEAALGVATGGASLPFTAGLSSLGSLDTSIATSPGGGGGGSLGAGATGW